MKKQEWNFMNSLPAVVRKKTNDYLLAKSARMQEERKDLMIVEKTRDEVDKIIETSPHFKKIEDYSYLSTLDGYYLLNPGQACDMYKSVLTMGDDEYAATVVTAYDPKTKMWKSLIDL